MPFIDTNQLKVKEPLPGWRGRYFHSDNMTFAYYAVAAGASIHEHAHPNEEVWHVIEGRARGHDRRADAGRRPRFRGGGAGEHAALSQGPERRAVDRRGLPAPQNVDLSNSARSEMQATTCHGSGQCGD